MERRRRIQAYGLCRDEDGRVVLMKDEWALPGGTVGHGEHPATTVTRAFGELGLRVSVGKIRDLFTDFDIGDVITHDDRLVFDVRVLSGTLTGAVRVDPSRAATLALAPFTAHALGIAPVGETMAAPHIEPPSPLAAGAGPIAPPARFQRFAAYGLVTDPEGRILLTRIASRYPGAGRWHLPGGGTDFGETAAAGLVRELVEETNQHGRVTGLIWVSHRHQREAVGPERVPIDWHAVRVVFRAEVDQPTEPRVMEGGGSTDAASWFTAAEALTLDLTEVAHDAVAKRHAQ